MSLNESFVEEAALEWFGKLVPQLREVGHGPLIAFSMPDFRRQDQLMRFGSDDPACGFGGMFVRSEFPSEATVCQFVESHGGAAKCGCGTEKP